MARVTVEDCLSVVNNRFDLVLLAAKRARELADRGRKVEPLVVAGNDKPTVIALREIAAKLVTQTPHAEYGEADTGSESSAEQALAHKSTTDGRPFDD